MATSTPADVFPSGVKPFTERVFPKTICMFDVDGTLTPARKDATPDTMAKLAQLRGFTAVAFVGGSDLVKIQEQLGAGVGGHSVIELFDYCFSENGLIAYKLGKSLPSASFIKEVGEEQYKKLVNFILRYLSELDIPIKRGTFIEFRTGMINVSPIGRNASYAERLDFNKYDQEHNIRSTMIQAIQKEFPHLNMTYSIGGQLSFDVFPTGWDKRYSLSHIQGEGFDQIHFFGDKTFKGGNDYEIFSDERTIGHSVDSPEHTIKLLEQLFLSKSK